MIYANEADVLNVAMFGLTAKQWREANPTLKGNIRDYATINEYKGGRCPPKKNYSCTSKESFPTPQSGQTQLSGISSKAVPGAIPLSGSPLAGS